MFTIFKNFSSNRHWIEFPSPRRWVEYELDLVTCFKWLEWAGHDTPWFSKSEHKKAIDVLPGPLLSGCLSLECSHHTEKKPRQLGEALTEENWGSWSSAPAAFPSNSHYELASQVSSNLGSRLSSPQSSCCTWHQMEQRSAFTAKPSSNYKFTSKINNSYC